MSRIWVEIESLVLDGVRMDAAGGRRLAALTERALERLLRERGAGVPASGRGEKDKKRVRSNAGGDEARWAEELAEVLYRNLDRGA